MWAGETGLQGSDSLDFGEQSRLLLDAGDRISGYVMRSAKKDG